MQIIPNDGSFGAKLIGVDLTAKLSRGTVEAIRKAWLAHQVIYFPNQIMSLEDLERFTLTLGEFGDDPYVQSMANHQHILEVKREPDEKVSPFGAAWHSDWSFQSTPPSATILHAKVVPPVGGDTWYASGYSAYDALSENIKETINEMMAIHSAHLPYSQEGFFAAEQNNRSMTILPSDTANDRVLHPLVRVHPETNKRALWVNSVYTIGIEGMEPSAANALLEKLCTHSVQPQFLYKHSWQENMLTIWDNRCVQHSAQGGYDGHARVMHRTTVAGDTPRGISDNS